MSLLILSNEEKTNDYENFEKGMVYMKILKKGGGVVEKRGEEETKAMPHAPVINRSCPSFILLYVILSFVIEYCVAFSYA